VADLRLIDLYKAFDKVKHYALQIKRMKRRIPVEQLELLENLFSYHTLAGSATVL